MPTYDCEAPSYRLFPYERHLRAAEIMALTGAHTERNNGSLVVRTSAKLGHDVLGRLAFTSRICENGTCHPTDVARLEASSLMARYGTSEGRRKESTYLVHGLHRYKGKFYPQLSRALINLSGVYSGDLVFDPFAGSGTTLVEAWLTGVESIGFDLNPLAQLVAATKLSILQAGAGRLDSAIGVLERKLVTASRRLDMSWRGLGSEEPCGEDDFPAETLAKACGSLDLSGEFHRWFPGPVRHKLAVITRALSRVEDRVARDFFRVVLSDLVRSVSQQDPRDLRIRRRAEPIHDAPVLSLFFTKLLRELAKLREGDAIVERRRQRPPLALAELADIRTFVPTRHNIFGSRRADAVVTSPPYATALPYVDTDRLSYLVLGLASPRERSCLERELIGSRELLELERGRLENELSQAGVMRELPGSLQRDLGTILRENRRHPVGFRRRNVPALLYRYFRDMRVALSAIRKGVRPGGRLLFVLGDGRTRLGDGRWLAIRTCDHIVDLGASVGLRILERIPITVTTEDLAHTKNAITENEILVFERI